MKIGITRSVPVLATLAVAAWAPRALAQDTTQQTTTTTTAPAQVVPAPAPASQTVVVAPQQPAATTQTTSAPVAVQGTGPTSESSVSGYAPNTILLASGLAVFGIPYITSVIVAGSSGNDADHHLYIPLAGPWVDLANRGGCPAGNSSCDSETTNKVMLGVDGVFQAIGAIEIVSAFLTPEHRSVTTVPATAYTPAITIQPEKIGIGGYGVGAFARF